MSDPTPRDPFFLQEAEAHYGHAFEVETPEDLEAAMARWAELQSSDRSFIMAHLLYLNLKAHAVTQRLTIQARNLIDEVADHVALGVEQILPSAEPEFPELDELPAGQRAIDPGASPADGEARSPTDGVRLPPEAQGGTP